MQAEAQSIRKRGRRPKPNKDVKLYCFVRPGLADTLATAAERERRSVSNYIALTLESVARNGELIGD